MPSNDSSARRARFMRFPPSRRRYPSPESRQRNIPKPGTRHPTPGIQSSRNGDITPDRTRAIRSSISEISPSGGRAPGSRETGRSTFTSAETGRRPTQTRAYRGNRQTLPKLHHAAPSLKAIGRHFLRNRRKAEAAGGRKSAICSRGHNGLNCLRSALAFPVPNLQILWSTGIYPSTIR